jgi:8-oxo-dGTP pyrophosphatase MutT (NUDIX family)
VTKSARQAVDDEDWLGTFNLWIVRNAPEPAIIYQQRPSHGWAPNLLDVSAGGYYAAGEQFIDGLREVEEELGKRYRPEEVVYLGRRTNVSSDSRQRVRRSVVDVYITRDDSALSSYVLDAAEVPAIFVCRIDDLERVHSDRSASFEADGVSSQGGSLTTSVTASRFPANSDAYHARIAAAAKEYLRGGSLKETIAVWEGAGAILR